MFFIRDFNIYIAYFFGSYYIKFKRFYIADIQYVKKLLLIINVL